MSNKAPRINFSKSLKDQWAKSAYAILVVKKSSEKNAIPSESWVRGYLNSLHIKISGYYRGIAVNEENFFSDDSREAILGTLEVDAQIDKKNSEFIPLTAQALKASYRQGFSIGR